MSKRREREQCPLCGCALANDLHGESCRNCGYSRSRVVQSRKRATKTRAETVLAHTPRRSEVTTR